MGVRKNRKIKILLALVVVFAYLVALLTLGTRVLRAEDLSGGAPQTASDTVEVTIITETTSAVTEATSAVTETTSVAEETTAVIEATTAVFETTIATGETTEESTAATTQAVAETTTTSDTLITPEATTAPEPTSAPTTTSNLAGNEKKDPAPLELGIMAAPPILGAALDSPIQILTVTMAGPYESDPDYTAVLLSGSATNDQAMPYILWIQDGEILVAVKSNKDALTMSIDGQPSIYSLAFPELATISVDDYTDLDPRDGLTGTTNKARWEIFAFPMTVLNTSGSYTLNVTFQGGGADI